jgi:hypothetical protein
MGLSSAPIIRIIVQVDFLLMPAGAEERARLFEGEDRLVCLPESDSLRLSAAIQTHWYSAHLTTLC